MDRVVGLQASGKGRQQAYEGRILATRCTCKGGRECARLACPNGRFGWLIVVGFSAYTAGLVALGLAFNWPGM